MTENHKARIDAIIRDGYEFKMGDYISNGFKILQKELGLFILFSLLTSFIAIIVSIVPILGWIAAVLLVVPLYTVGVLNVSHKIHREEKVEFSDFFKGFDKLGQLVLAGLIIFLISSALQLPFYFSNAEFFEWYAEILESPQSISDLQPPIINPLAYFLMIPSFLVSVAYVFTYPFIWFFDLNFWDAMEASRKVTFKSFLMVVVFVFIASLIGGAGVILCCIGMLATYPAYISMIYSAFADITKLNEEPGAGSNIDQHLIVD